MPSESNSALPVAGFTLATVFLTAASLLTQQPFDSLRPLETDLTQQIQASGSGVDARLWEDPFATLRRYRENLRKLCLAERREGVARDDVQHVTAKSRCTDEGLDDSKQFVGREGELTVIVVPLSGDAFVGGEEARRRTRYALLSGLNAAGFIPDNSERLGLLKLALCESLIEQCYVEPRQEVRPKAEPTVSASRTLVASNVGTPGSVPSLKSVATPSGPPVALVPGDTRANGESAGSAQKPQIQPVSPVAQDLNPRRVEVVYETLSPSVRRAAADKSAPNIVVVWVDEKSLGKHWLSAITYFIPQLTLEPKVRLRVLGPTNSKTLASALSNDLQQLLEKLSDKPNKGEPREPISAEAKSRVKQLLNLRLLSPSSTAPDPKLLEEVHSSHVQDTVGATFDHFLKEIAGKVDATLPSDEPIPFYFPTIGTDDRLIERLVEEFRARHLAGKRMALVSEWDTIYARSLVATLREQLQCDQTKGSDGKGCSRAVGLSLDLVSHQYLRGLDGMTLAGAMAPASPNDGRAFSGAREKPAVEWPEGRDQRDYVRRLVELRLALTESRQGDDDLYAIGIIGTDIHDKLVLAQALRPSFPDRLFYTTDLDAGLLHPSVSSWTRNLIVATSLPLSFLDRELQCGAAPFRDTYQTAMFLAARLSAAPVPTSDVGKVASAAAPDASVGGEKGQAADGEDCKLRNAWQIAGSIHAELAKPLLFEISRSGLVELTPAFPHDKPRTIPGEREQASRRDAAMAFGAILILVASIVLFFHPGPAMQAARPFFVAFAPPAMRHWKRASVFRTGCSSSAAVILSGLQIAAFGFSGAVVFELGRPGRIGPYGPLIVAALAAAVFGTFVYPGTPWVRKARLAGFRHLGAAGVWNWLVSLLQVLAFVGIFFGWRAWVAQSGTDSDIHEPFALLNGASAWPSQLLRTLVILLFARFLDSAWCRSALATHTIRARYFRSPVAQVAQATKAWSAAAVFRSISIWFWEPQAARPGSDGAIGGAALWNDYRKCLGDRARLGRLFCWLVFSSGFSYLVLFGLVGGTQPEVPARGLSDRDMFTFTLYAGAFAVMGMIVMVADVTILTWRYIELMRHGRTSYPPAVVNRFAAELGAAAQATAASQITADAARRSPGQGRNSILDDWIDMHMLAEHSAAIGRFIFFPLILISLMIVARSQLFDNWLWGEGLLILFTAFVLWSVAMAILLNSGADKARKLAVDRMEADLVWLKGSGSDYAILADQFPRLIEQVKSLRHGAFAPFFEQPMVQAILLPLGSAGGVQLLQYLLFGH